MEDPQSLFLEAESALKTSIFKWSPDWLTASHYFEKAGNGFRLRKQIPEAVQAFSRAADAQAKANLDEACARTNEDLGELVALRENYIASPRTLVEITERYEKAASIFIERGDPERAASSDLKAGRTLEKMYEKTLTEHDTRKIEGLNVLENLKQLAIKHYLSSCEKVLKSDRLSTGIEAFPACLNFSLKVKDYKTALDMLSRMVKIYSALNQTYRVHQCYLSQVVLQLKRNDAVGARNVFEASLNDNDYLRSGECEAAEKLLTAWERRDQEIVREVATSHTMNGLGREVCLVARGLDPYGIGFENTTSISTDKAKPQGIIPNETEMKTGISTDGQETEKAKIEEDRVPIQESSNAPCQLDSHGKVADVETLDDTSTKDKNVADVEALEDTSTEDKNVADIETLKDISTEGKSDAPQSGIMNEELEFLR